METLVRDTYTPHYILRPLVALANWSLPSVRLHLGKHKFISDISNLHAFCENNKISEQLDRWLSRLCHATRHPKLSLVWDIKTFAQFKHTCKCIHLEKCKCVHLIINWRLFCPVTVDLTSKVISNKSFSAEFLGLWLISGHDKKEGSRENVSLLSTTYNYKWGKTF